MNNDLISREALRKAFHERIWYFDKSSWDEANALIDNAPTVEAFTKEDMAGAYNEGYACGSRENTRPQGEWKVDDKIYCSECGASICDFVPNPTDAIVIILENKFCFNCGAKMKGGAV